MKKLLLVLVLVLFLSGCSGVIMSAEYSALLDKTCALSAETALRAHNGDMDSLQMRDALMRQAITWQRFRDAKNGVKSEDEIK